MYRTIKVWLTVRLGKRAVTSLEYGIISAIVVVTGLASFSSVGTKVQNRMNSVKAVMS